MAEASEFRRFTWPEERCVNTDFIPSKLKENKAFMKEDLARSGLTPKDIDAYVKGNIALPGTCLAGYVIPYTHPDGSPLSGGTRETDLQMWRMRCKYPDYAVDPPRYKQPTGEELEPYGISSTPPFIPFWYHDHDKSEVLCICEGEKKTVCVSKYTSLSSIGIGGCENWRAKKGTSEVHPWIIEIAKQHKRILVIPDGDLRRYDICRAYGTFTNRLGRLLEGIDIQIMLPDDKIDDLIVKWGPEAEANFYDIPTIKPAELVESPASLATEFNLAFRRTKEGAVQVYEHSANIMILIEEHKAFEHIWRDFDTNTLMIGDQNVTPDVTEMIIANHFQYNFQMTRVGHKMVRDVIKALAEKHGKSPMLEWVESQVWDHIPRLDTWMTRLWGCEDTEYVKQVSARWLIGAVARMREPGCKLDWILITTGGQGIGKSSMPVIVFRGNVVNMYGQSSDKDTHMKLHNGLCMIIDEMDSLNKGEITYWKSLITAQEDRFRPPYGSAVRTFPRRNLIYGTSNVESFLAEDRSGYRRYMPVKVPGMLNFVGLEEELGQLWAEAAHRQGLGEPYWEITAEDVHKDDYIVADPMIDKVHQFLLEWCIENSKHLYSDSWEFKILDYAMWADEGTKFNSTVWSRQVVGHLKSFGVEKVNNLKTQKGRGYRFSRAALKRLNQ